MNRSRLPKGIVAVARVGRLPGGRGFDLFVTMMRKRVPRKLAIARDNLPRDIILALLTIEPDDPWTEVRIESVTGSFAGLVEHGIGQKQAHDIEQPPSGATLATLFKGPGATYELLEGDVKNAETLPAEVKALLDALGPSGRPTPDTRDEVTKIIDEVELDLGNDLDGDGSVGGKPGGGGGGTPLPKLARYSFSGLGFSFTYFNAPYSVSNIGGNACGGDPLTAKWSLSLTNTDSGGDHPGTTPPRAIFANGNPARAGAVIFPGAGGAPDSKVTFFLTYAAGAPPTMNLTTESAGDVANVSVSAKQAPVTVTKVVACPPG